MRLFVFLVFLGLMGSLGAYLRLDNPFYASKERLTTVQRQSIEHDLKHTFNTWAGEDRPQRAGLVITFSNGDTKAITHGRLDMDDKRSIASLSKAVTGLCTAGLIMDGKIALNDNVGKLLSSYFSQLGNPKDNRVSAITIGHLLSHYSGFAGIETRKDPTIYHALTPTVREKGVRGTHFDALVSLTLSKRLATSPGNRYIYSNANYLVLGKIIEEISGESYEDYCEQRVLEKAGVSASIDPDGKILSSYAGWYLSPSEVTKVFSLFDPSSGFLSKELLDWNSSPNGKGVIPSRKLHYGLGAMVSKRFGDDWYFHEGWWDRYPASNRDTGSLAKSYATLAFHTDEGVGIFAVVEPAFDLKSTNKLRDWIIHSYNRGLEKAE